MSDLLKEAIADAKAVRETALQNAKAALEEAFTPQLKSMLSAKLQEDEFDEDLHAGYHEDEHEDEDEVDVDDVPAVDPEVPVDDELPIDDEDGDSVPDDEEEAEEGHGMHDGMHEDGMEEGGFLAPAVGGALGAAVAPDDLPGGAATGAGLGAGIGSLLDPTGDEDDEEFEENLDLESVIRELEEETSNVRETRTPQSSEQIVEEEYEIDEAELDEDREEDLTAEEVEALYHIANNSVNELAEYKEAVHFLKDKLHEVNILNAKLLYTNKLFKEWNLDNNQKLKIVETFDRAHTTREIKLVYSTIGEQLNENVTIPKRKPLKEVASKPIASTKPSKESQKVITEETQVADRFRKLAGLIKG